MADDIGVVFVSYHSEHLVAPLAEVYRDAGLTVQVVDNSSTYSGGADVVDPGRNVGFGGGCNLGVRALPSRIRWVCFHNPDVDAAPEVLCRLVATLSVRPSAGAIAPVEVTRSSVRTVGYAYPSPARELYLGTRVRLQLDRASRPASTPEPEAVTSPTSSSRSTAPVARARRFPAFCFVVVDRAAFDLVGGFDERYFLYAEDLDLWHRLCIAGRPGLFDRSSSVHHRVGTSSPVALAVRELFRWTGVEIFAERFESLGWRRYRAVHRLVLRTYPPGALRERLGELWAQGRTPTEVAATLRADVESGALALS